MKKSAVAVKQEKIAASVKAATENAAQAAVNTVVAETAITVNPAASAPVVNVPSGKRISHLKMNVALLSTPDITDAAILAAFAASFRSRGVTCADFIRKRAAIYIMIAAKQFRASGNTALYNRGLSFANNVAKLEFPAVKQ